MAEPIPPNPITMKQPNEEIGLVQGIMPDSINEWYVAQALDKMRADYQFQYVIYGGTSVRGGQTIDFVVYSPIGKIPVYVQGAYWHNFRHDPDAIFKQAEAARYFKNPVVLLDEDETNTRDKALVAVRRKVLV